MCLGHVDAAWEETARIAIRAGVFVHAGEPLPRLGGRHFQKPRTREHEGGPQRIEGEDCGVHIFSRKFFVGHTEPARLTVASSLAAHVCPWHCCQLLDLRGGFDSRAERLGTLPFLCLQLHIRRRVSIQCRPLVAVNFPLRILLPQCSWRSLSSFTPRHVLPRMHTCLQTVPTPWLGSP